MCEARKAFRSSAGTCLYFSMRVEYLLGGSPPMNRFVSAESGALLTILFHLSGHQLALPHGTPPPWPVYRASKKAASRRKNPSVPQSRLLHPSGEASGTNLRIRRCALILSPNRFLGLKRVAHCSTKNGA